MADRERARAEKEQQVRDVQQDDEGEEEKAEQETSQPDNKPKIMFNLNLFQAQKDQPQAEEKPEVKKSEVAGIFQSARTESDTKAGDTNKRDMKSSNKPKSNLDIVSILSKHYLSIHS